MKLVVLLLLMISLSFSAEVAIGFGKLTPDEDIIKLLEKCNAKVRAIWYESPYGSGGSYSRKDWSSAHEFFKGFRKTLSDEYRHMSFSLAIYLKIIIDNHLISSQDLKIYTPVKKFVKGLVNGYLQYYHGHSYIKSGGPIVYAVLAKTDDVDCIEKSELVKDISVNYFPLFTAFLKYVPYYFRPKRYGQYYFFPEVKNAKPEELYKMMQKAVKELENNKEFIQYYEENYIKKYYKGKNFYQHRLEFLKKSIEHKKELSVESSNLGTPPPTYFPNEGDIEYTGTTVVRYNLIQWNNPGDWSVDMPGYEHDLVAKRDYFTECRSYSDLPNWYDDCPTACVSEGSGDYCAFSFGTYNALLIEPEFPYWGRVNLTRGSAVSTNFRLNAQEVFHSPKCFELLNRWICIPCPFDTSWCMGGTPYRDGNPYLRCPTNSLILKTCEFRRFLPYGSAWSGKYDCTPANWCD